MTDAIIRTPEQRDKVVAFIRALDLRHPWALSVKPYRKKRSLNQNDLLHEWIGIIAKETGGTTREVKAGLKDLFLPNVIVRVGRHRRLVKMSTADLDTAECSEFMDKIIAFAGTELGIMLPTPEDRL